MKKFITAFISLALVFSLAVPICAAEAGLRDESNVSLSFSDVSATYWGYDAIMAMTQIGLLGRTTAPVDGVGTFNPDAKMTRAEFIVIMTRYLYADELDAMPEGKNWYDNNYQLGVSHGLVVTSEFNWNGLNDAMTRQEMAAMLVRAAEQLGEDTGVTISESEIPDYDSVGANYREYVLTAYGMGLIGGVDSEGTFNPKGTLTRAQAATVIYRLLEPDTRIAIVQTEGNAD